MRLGQYMWYTIQSHRAMIEFQEADFRFCTSMAPSVVNHLFRHRDTKIDVYSLNTKPIEQDNTFNKQEKVLIEHYPLPPGFPSLGTLLVWMMSKS